jgi:hypothetical protein
LSGWPTQCVTPASRALMTHRSKTGRRFPAALSGRMDGQNSRPISRWSAEIAPAVHQEIQRGHGPHQGVLEAGLVPEISAHPPALIVGHDEENDDRKRGRPGEQSEREQRSADQLCQRDRQRPEFSRPISVILELLRQFRHIVRPHSCARPQSQGVAQPVRDEREADHNAQQHLRPRRECLVELTQVRKDERSRIRHSVVIRAMASAALTGLGATFSDTWDDQGLQPDFAEVDAYTKSRLDCLVGMPRGGDLDHVVA